MTSLRPGNVELVEDGSGPATTVAGPQQFYLIEECVDRLSHQPAAIRAEDHVGRGQEPAPGLLTEGARAGPAEHCRQARQPLVRTQTQGRRVHAAADEKV